MPTEISVCEIVAMPIACSEQNLPYWLRIMMEHAIFIENGLPAQREDLRAQAARFQAAFRDLLTRAAEMPMMNCAEIAAYMQAVRATVVSFITFKRMLIALALKCQVGGLGGFNYVLLLDHITRRPPSSCTSWTRRREEWPAHSPWPLVRRHSGLGS